MSMTERTYSKEFVRLVSELVFSPDGSQENLMIYPKRKGELTRNHRTEFLNFRRIHDCVSEWKDLDAAFDALVSLAEKAKEDGGGTADGFVMVRAPYIRNHQDGGGTADEFDKVFSVMKDGNVKAISKEIYVIIARICKERQIANPPPWQGFNDSQVMKFVNGDALTKAMDDSDDDDPDIEALKSLSSILVTVYKYKDDAGAREHLKMRNLNRISSAPDSCDGIAGIETVVTTGFREIEYEMNGNGLVSHRMFNKDVAEREEYCRWKSYPYCKNPDADILFMNCTDCRCEFSSLLFGMVRCPSCGKESIVPNRVVNGRFLELKPSFMERVREVINRGLKDGFDSEILKDIAPENELENAFYEKYCLTYQSRAESDMEAKYLVRLKSLCNEYTFDNYKAVLALNDQYQPLSEGNKKILTRLRYPEIMNEYLTRNKDRYAAEEERRSAEIGIKPITEAIEALSAMNEQDDRSEFVKRFDDLSAKFNVAYAISSQKLILDSEGYTARFTELESRANECKLNNAKERLQTLIDRTTPNQAEMMIRESENYIGGLSEDVKSMLMRDTFYTTYISWRNATQGGIDDRLVKAISDELARAGAENSPEELERMIDRLEDLYSGASPTAKVKLTDIQAKNQIHNLKIRVSRLKADRELNEKIKGVASCLVSGIAKDRGEISRTIDEVSAMRSEQLEEMDKRFGIKTLDVLKSMMECAKRFREAEARIDELVEKPMSRKSVQEIKIVERYVGDIPLDRIDEFCTGSHYAKFQKYKVDLVIWQSKWLVQPFKYISENDESGDFGAKLDEMYEAMLPCHRRSVEHLRKSAGRTSETADSLSVLQRECVTSPSPENFKKFWDEYRSKGQPNASMVAMANHVTKLEDDYWEPRVNRINSILAKAAPAKKGLFGRSKGPSIDQSKLDEINGELEKMPPKWRDKVNWETLKSVSQ